MVLWEKVNRSFVDERSGETYNETILRWGKNMQEKPLPLICVYSASSVRIADKYFIVARELSQQMVKNGYGLCFGGGKRGLMGAMADEILKENGTLVGVIPEALMDLELAHECCTELVVTQTMRQRKQTMEDKSEAFIALPGGFGTFEELLEIITLKQLGYHTKPIVILNAFGYYDALLAQFEMAYREEFAGREDSEIYFVAEDADNAVRYIKEYKDRGKTRSKSVVGFATDPASD